MTPGDTHPPRDDANVRLETHPVYRSVRDLHSLRTFLEHHVVCVLDFMSLVKRLQAELTCVQVPWVPPAHPEAAHLINSIVLDEETDEAFGDTPLSHYAWYLKAMDEVGADTQPIRELESRLRAGIEPTRALEGCGLPPAAEAFARTTFELAASSVHEVAAAFLYGRENVIPTMFIQLVRELRSAGVECELLVRYLERHIEVDSEDHGPAARRLLDTLLEDDATRRREAHAAASRALEARELLWDATARACTETAHA